MEALTIDEFKEVLPANMCKALTPLTVMKINNTLESPEEWELYRDNLLGFSNILETGKYKLESYLSAVRYVGFKVMNYTNIEAHRRTFPDRHMEYKAKGISAKDISSYVAAYSKSKLVIAMITQAVIPTCILNADTFQKAINVSAAIMIDEEVSAKVRVDAANNLMNCLKPPEVKKVELDLGIKESPMLQELKNITMGLAMQQHAAIEAGNSTPLQVAHQTIVEAEVIE